MKFAIGAMAYAVAPVSLIPEEKTMQVICTKRVHFNDYEYKKDPKTGDLVSNLKRELVVVPNRSPQEVPEWIKTDPLYDILEEDGTIMEVVVKVVKKKGGEEKPVPTMQEPVGFDKAVRDAKPPTEAGAWGASLQGAATGGAAGSK
jgi:hypothetical protein